MPKSIWHDAQPSLSLRWVKGVVSTAEFCQEQLIQEINKKSRNEIFLFKRKGSRPFLDVSGVCGGLVPMWYKYLANEKNLIDTLKELPHDWEKKEFYCNLIRMIQRYQEKYSGALMPISEKHGLRQENKKYSSEPVDDTIHEDVDNARVTNMMAELDFTDATLSKLIGRTSLYEHLKSEGPKDRFERGFHQIDIGSFETKESAHTIAFTKIDDGYLLFDPNTGETLYESIEVLAIDLCFHRLLNMFNGPTEQTYIIRDFYENLSVPATEADIVYSSSSRPINAIKQSISYAPS